MNNQRIYIYEEFLKNKLWDLKMLEELRKINHINGEEYNKILTNIKKFEQKEKDVKINTLPLTYEIWDKKSPINGVTAEAFLNMNPTIKKAKDVFLIKNPNNGMIECVESVDIIKGNERLKKNLDVEDVAEYYTSKLNNSKNTINLNDTEYLNSQSFYNNIIKNIKIDHMVKLLEEINNKLQIIIEKEV